MCKYRIGVVLLACSIESTVAWETNRFRLMSSGSLRYLDGQVNGFTETGPGVRMQVDSLDTRSLLLELGVDAEFDLTERIILNSHLGVLADLRGSDDTVSASYAGGGLPVAVNAPGIDNEAFTLGIGASFDVNETTRVNLDWRSELRDGSQDAHLFSLGGLVTF